LTNAKSEYQSICKKKLVCSNYQPTITAKNTGQVNGSIFQHLKKINTSDRD